MHSRYLGETIVDIQDTPYKDFTLNDWVLWYIGSYGGCDGAHHKNWVLDQVVRILKGNKIIIKIAKWEDGTINYRIDLDDEPTEEYNQWVEERKGELIEIEDGEYEYEYGYDTGVAP